MHASVESVAKLFSQTWDERKLPVQRIAPICPFLSMKWKRNRYEIRYSLGLCLGLWRKHRRRSTTGRLRRTISSSCRPWNGWYANSLPDNNGVDRSFCLSLNFIINWYWFLRIQYLCESQNSVSVRQKKKTFFLNSFSLYFSNIARLV